MEIENDNSFAIIQSDHSELDRNNLTPAPESIGQANSSGSNDEILENPQLAGEVETHPKNPKFKSFDSLEKAYDLLQAEFTRKSQELADLKKSTNVDKVNDAPAFLADDWASRVSQFFDEHPYARQYKSEISNLLVEDNSIKNDSRPLDKALIKILSTHISAPQDLVENEEFLDKYIYSNASIKEKIISDYVLSLAKKETPPLISKSFASNLATNKVSQPKTLKAVKELVAKMFQ